MRRFFSFIASIFRVLWRGIDWFRRSLANLVFLILLAVVLFAIFGGKGGVAELQTGALRLEPAGDLTEQLAGQPPEVILQRLQGLPPSQLLVEDLVAMIDRAAVDDDIKALVIYPEQLGRAELTKLQSVADAMARFRDSGKPSFAYGQVLTQGQYFLAAQADEISIDPMGMVLIRGYGVFPRYYAEALEKFGVNMNVFRVGEFKSAVEPFLRNDMSEEAKRANRDWLGSLWLAYLEGIAARRPFSADEFQQEIENFADKLEALNGDSAQLAMSAKLVDRIESPYEFRQRMADKFGEGDEPGTYKSVGYSGYLQAARRAPSARKKSVENVAQPSKIARITAVGSIRDGEQPPGNIGGATLAALLREAQLDDEVAAVVLRVDSPGGSVSGSEQARRALVALRDSGKPVVVSMGTYAASGGYWISMNANEIWAEPTTLTGSIGIFGLLPNFSPLLERNGVSVDGVGTTPWAEGIRVDKPLSPAVERGMQSMIENGYDEFISKVAMARGMTREKVDELARGRVWIGRTAQTLGLVDSLGGLKDAENAARRLAKLPGSAEVKVIESGQAKALRMIQQLAGEAADGRNTGISAWFGTSSSLRGWLKVIEQQLAPLEQAVISGDPRGLYAHCECEHSSG